jgi:hypothetical protein
MEVSGMGHRSQRWSRSASAGLVAVQVVGEASSPSTVRQTLEVECPGGALVRLREDVSAEVLERVLRVCQQLQDEAVAVRSC